MTDHGSLPRKLAYGPTGNSVRKGTFDWPVMAGEQGKPNYQGIHAAGAKYGGPKLVVES